MAKTPKSKCAHPRSAVYYANITQGARSGYTCSDCETSGLSAPAAPGGLDRGIYKLEAPVVNAGKDGRSKAWNGQAQFPAGTYYVVRNLRDNLLGRGFVDYGCRIQRAGSRHDRVEPGHRGYDALVAALVPVEGTTEQFIECEGEQFGQGYSAAAEVILAQLIDSGKITRADVLASIKATDEKRRENG